jgi:hypothetical protein
MTQMAKNADPEIQAKDVQILADIAKTISQEPAPELVKIVAMLSQSGSADANSHPINKQGWILENTISDEKFSDQFFILEKFPPKIA